MGSIFIANFCHRDF